MESRLPPAQMSESFRIGALLALAGGFFDVYTYLCRGVNCCVYHFSCLPPLKLP